jgi:16S rRNA (uracil1498-N3)-methyltransferase
VHRFFVDPGSVSERRVDFPENAARQSATVLRLRPGEVVAVFDGSGSEWTVRLDQVSASTMHGEIVDKRRPRVEPAVALTLCQAVLKADRFEFVLQRCTEAGVARFQPFISARGVAEMPRGPKLARWERIVQEAAEQSGRVTVPPILPPVPIAELALGADIQPAVVLWEEETKVPLYAALERVGGGRTPTRLSLIIGPEGGLESREVEALASEGIVAASIGPRVLRAETAALAATVATLYHFGQMER